VLMSHSDTRPVVGERGRILFKDCTTFGKRLMGQTLDNNIQEAQKNAGLPEWPTIKAITAVKSNYYPSSMAASCILP